MGWSKFVELGFCCTAPFSGFGEVRKNGLGAFFHPANLGERVSLESDCSCPAALGDLKSGGLSAPPTQFKRGDLELVRPRAPWKSNRGRPDVSQIAPRNLLNRSLTQYLLTRSLGVLQEVK